MGADKSAGQCPGPRRCSLPFDPEVVAKNKAAREEHKKTLDGVKRSNGANKGKSSEKSNQGGSDKSPTPWKPPRNGTTRGFKPKKSGPPPDADVQKTYLYKKRHDSLHEMWMELYSSY